MEQLVINAKARTTTGKAEAKRMRKQGVLPAVLYNSEGKSFMVQVNEVEFNKVWRGITSSTLVTLNLDGTNHDVFIKDTEYNIRNDKVLHADFYEPAADKAVVFRLPVHCVGTPAGVLKGGFLLKRLPQITVKAVAKKIPARVEADISAINIGESFCVKDLKLGEGVAIIESPDSKLASVVPSR